MNYVMRSYDAGKKPSSSLSVYECGWQQCGAGHSLGLQKRQYYCIHYIVSGKGSYQYNGHTYSLKAGDGFVILPDTEILYQADQEDPWEYYWVGFHGSEAPILLKQCGLDKNQVLFSYTQDRHLRDLMEDLYSASSEYASREYAMIGYLYLFFSCLIRYQMDTAHPSMQYISSACQYIQTHYTQAITIADITQHVGIERSYLHRIFKRFLGYSVHEYLQSLRLHRAREFLDEGRLSISEIATACGFESASYFSRVYKQTIGVSPAAYRKSATRS